MSKKILYVITKGNWGGAQKYVFELATKISKENFETSVALGDGDILENKLKGAGILVYKIKRLGRNINIFKDFLVFFDLLRLFKKIKPDVVHLNSSKAGGLGALAARFAGIKKIIFTVHGFAFNENRSWLSKKVIAFLSWLTIVFSTDIIFISNIEKTRASHWPFVSKKSHIIYNGIVMPEYLDKNQARHILAEKLSISENAFENKTVVGTIAELTENKGLVFAIDALKEIQDTIYIIIGAGELEKELREEIKIKQIENKIFLAGFMKDASTLLKAFDIFLLPSLKEGMPYVLLEAGLASLPVITTQVGGISEMIQENETGLFIKTKNPSSIIEKINYLKSNSNMANNMGEKLKNNIQEKFSVDKMLAETTKAYSDLL